VRGALVSTVAAVLDEESIPFAVIGAAALAWHGYSRATSDIDLVTTSSAALDIDWAARIPDADVHVRRGDAEDPLAGVVRFRREPDSDIDLVIGRWRWQSEAIARAERVDLGFARLPATGAADLVLFKLDAAGPGDLRDVEQLLAIKGDALVARVEELLPDIVSIREEWTRLRRATRS
jgi:hypothetical protein